MVWARLVLLGGIGSGKSTAAGFFCELGASTFSGDHFAREVLAPGTEATRLVIERWPEVADGGSIDRRRLGRLVFPDGALLGELEAIVHPATRTALAEAVAGVPEDHVVVEMPIIRDWFEGWTVVVVDAPDEVRMARAMARPGDRTEAEIRAVMNRQPSRGEWLLAADLVIANGADLVDLERECLAVWRRVTAL